MIKFELTKEQEVVVNKFHPKCKKKYTGAIGVGGEYRFTNTSLGVIVEYVCICGKKLDLTNDNW